MRKKTIIQTTFIYLVLMLFVFIMMFPFLYLFLSSFKSNIEFMSNPGKLLPESFSMDNYKSIFNSVGFDLPLLLKNSIYYTVVCVIINILSALVGAYVFARGEFPLKKTIFAVYCSLMFITVGSISIYPTFDVLEWLNVPRSINGLIFTKVFGIPITFTFLVKGYIESLPIELDQAAEIDGCGFVGIFFKIILPLLKPIIATVVILSFKNTWNDYLMPAIFTLARPEQKTLMVALIDLKSSSEGANSWNLMLAASVIAVLPVIITFIFANKYFVQGLSDGAVKG